MDDNDNVVDVATTTSIVNNVGTFTATFERLLDTYEADDYVIRKSSTIDAIWAHGYILSSQMQYHGFQDDQKGAFRMFVPTYTVPVTPPVSAAYQGAFVGLMSIMFGLIALFI